MFSFAILIVLSISMTSGSRSSRWEMISRLAIFLRVCNKVEVEMILRREV